MAAVNDPAPKSLEFWFDISCPYAYLASTQVEALAERCGARLDPQPMLLGGVFRALEAPQNMAAAMNAAKARHNLDDMHRWARLWGVPLKMPSGHPYRTVTALRAMLAAGPDAFMTLAHAFYKAYWVDGADLSQPDELANVLTRAGYDAAPLLDEAQTQSIKDELRARTDRALERGVFGAPAFVVAGELIWGQDRLDLVERRLGGEPGPLGGADAQPPDRPVDYWFDYSSPYAAIAAERVDAVFGDRVRWRPMLLGAVFKQVGTANVPMFAQNKHKRRWTGREMARQAHEVGLPFNMPTRFPMKTTMPLRVTLLVEDDAAMRRLALRIFRAYWAEDQDISSDEVVAALCDEVGLDGAALVEASKAPAAKQALFDATSAAVEAGVFGAPTFIVHHPDRAPSLYWGADRLQLAALAAAGDERAF